jgi:hypothetical protein
MYYLEKKRREKKRDRTYWVEFYCYSTLLSLMIGFHNFGADISTETDWNDSYL